MQRNMAKWWKGRMALPKYDLGLDQLKIFFGCSRQGGLTVRET